MRVLLSYSPPWEPHSWGGGLQNLTLSESGTEISEPHAGGGRDARGVPALRSATGRRQRAPERSATGRVWSPLVPGCAGPGGGER